MRKNKKTHGGAKTNGIKCRYKRVNIRCFKIYYIYSWLTILKHIWIFLSLCSFIEYVRIKVYIYVTETNVIINDDCSFKKEVEIGNFLYQMIS